MPRDIEGEELTAATREEKRIINAPPIVVGLVLLLLALHGARLIEGGDWDSWALIPARLSEQWWSLVTYAFLHGDWVHVGLNSLWLLVFGTPVARWFGSARFLLIAASSAIGGALAMVIADPTSTVPVIGASGAVSGLMAAAIPVMYGRHGRPLLMLELLRDRRALIFVVIWLVITLASGAQALIDDEGIRIAWQAHLGGFATGLVAYAVLIRQAVRG